MDVYNIIFCQKAINDQRGGVTAQTVLSAITPEYVPGLFTFSVIITILNLYHDENHTIAISLNGPDNKPVLKTDNMPIPVIDSSVTNLPNEFFGANLAMDLNNVDFKTGGLYTLEVYLDSELQKEKTIFVRGKNEQSN